MNKAIFFLAFTILSFPSVFLNAQIIKPPSVISSSGAYSYNESFSISWTLGELAITTLQSKDIVFTQGFQQPSDFGVSVKKNDINWNISVYPNPVKNELNILFELNEPGDFLVEVLDVTGRVLIQEPQPNVSPGDLVIMNTSDFASGVYLLRILTRDFKQVKVISLRKL